ncbi:MAG TPA: alpha/beta hydrolase [Gemmataceae bacterium]|nr:alpha/beta hydrolase [Gemmataceae bacterium]
MFRRFMLALLCGLFLAAGFGRAEESFFDSGGVQIHYLVEGKGEPVLLIHGFAVNAQLQWGVPGIINTLARNYCVIALDVRGHGKSGKPKNPEKYGTEMVEDAVRLLDHLKIDKAHVVGYSMGAIITGKLMATHPDRLLSATLAGAGPIPEGAKLPKFVDKLADSLEEGKGLGPLLDKLNASGKSQLSQGTIKVISRSLVGENGKTLAAVVRSWKTLRVRKEQLQANKVPTLALVGSNDPLKKNIDLVQDDLANLKVVVIEGTNHFSTYYNPKFKHNLIKFLDEHTQQKQGPKKEPVKKLDFVEVDYSKIDRHISKQPKYNASPRYARFIFDPRGEFQVWAVLDKSKADAPYYDVLYFDKDGNGDLTETGERFTGIYDDKTKTLSIVVGALAVPGTKLVHTDLKFYTAERHNYKGFWFSMKWNGVDAVDGGYAPFSDNNTTYSSTAQTAPILRPTILGPLGFLTTDKLVLPIGGAKDVQLIVGNPGSGPDTLCAVHEHFLIPEKDRIIATLIAKDVAGQELRVRTEIKKHC